MLNERQRAKNVVGASYFMNGLVNNCPLAIKLEIRDATRAYMQGRDHYIEEDLKELKNIVNNIFKKWSVTDKPVWLNGKLKGSKDFENVYYFSTANPYKTITKEDLNKRSLLLKQLAELEKPYLKKRFGIEF